MAASTAGFSSRFAFLMASIGFAVGLGNIWRFPYVTGENGGGAFVIVYLVCVLVIGVPILIAEIMIGRRGAASPPNALRNLAVEEGRSPQWAWLGGLNVAAAFAILLVYAVVAGWVLLYLTKATASGFAGMDGPAASLEFLHLLADVPVMIGWTLVAILLSSSIIYFGVQGGIERAVRVLMPLLFVLLVLLAVYNYFFSGFSEAWQYLFSPDFSKINGGSVLAAVGQAFFSIGVAMAGMMTFGAYLPKHVSIVRSAFIVVFADTLVALVAGLVVFPAVFQFSLDPAGGTGLVFQTLPVAFAQMPGGHGVSMLFFLLLAVGATTSMVGLMEPIVAWLQESRSWARSLSTTVLALAIATLSVVSVLSNNYWAEVRLFGATLSSAMDFVPNQIMLPVGGLLISVFAGWLVSEQSAKEELLIGNRYGFQVWRTLVRYPVPLAVAAILLFALMG